MRPKMKCTGQSDALIVGAVLISQSWSMRICRKRDGRIRFDANPVATADETAAEDMAVDPAKEAAFLAGCLTKAKESI